MYIVLRDNPTVWQTFWVDRRSEAKQKSEGNLKFEGHIPALIFDEELIFDVFFFLPSEREVGCFKGLSFFFFKPWRV